MHFPLADEAMKEIVLPPLPEEPAIIEEVVHTWSIESWNSMSRKEHGSIFQAGGYPWYVLTIPRPPAGTFFVVLQTVAHSRAFRAPCPHSWTCFVGSWGCGIAHRASCIASPIAGPVTTFKTTKLIKVPM